MEEEIKGEDSTYNTIMCHLYKFVHNYRPPTRIAVLSHPHIESPWRQQLEIGLNAACLELESHGNVAAVTGFSSKLTPKLPKAHIKRYALFPQ